MNRIVHIITGLLVCIFCLPFSVFADITPSQVLVLYNADWQEDHPLTEPGQDSREIAEHYVKINTHAQTGEKPYILGLSSRQGSLLNAESAMMPRHSLISKGAGPPQSARHSCNVPR